MHPKQTIRKPPPTKQKTTGQKGKMTSMKVKEGLMHCWGLGPWVSVGVYNAAQPVAFMHSQENEILNPSKAVKAVC